MAEPIRVLVADDHAVVRFGVRMLLEGEPDIVVVGEARSGDQVLALADELQPDLVVMDITMPGTDGLEATRRLIATHPEVKVVVLTMHRSQEYLFEMLKAGASGYVLKGAETTDLINAVRVAAQGEVFLYPSMARQLVEDYITHADASAEAGPTLSPRESEVLQLLAQGHSNKDIAEKLVLSPSTVHTHRRNLMAKLGLSSRYELIQYALKRGLIQDA